MPSTSPTERRSGSVSRWRLGLAGRARGLAASLGARGLEAAAKFGLYALAARTLGGHDSGRFFLALGVIQIVSTIGRLGLERPMTRQVAAALAIGHGHAARWSALSGCLAIGGVSSLLAFALAFASPTMAEHFLNQPDMTPVLIMASAIIPVQNLAFGLAAVLIGLERGGAAQMVMNALAPTLTLAGLILGADDLDRLLQVYAGAFGVCVALGLMLVMVIFSRPPRRASSVDAAQTLPNLWQGARPLWVSDVAQAALLSIPVLVLGAFAPPAAVSIFSLCSRLSMLVTTVVISLGALSAPVFARHHHLGDWTALRDAVTANRRTTILLCVPLTIAMAAGAAPLLQLLGLPPEAAVPVLLILLAGQLVFCLLPSRDLMLAMAGHTQALRRLSLWQLVGCTLLCLVLIPALGPVGAALASTVTWISGATALAVSARRRMPQLPL